ncbi:hypothetical protein ZIOFF_042817 [Zingiber officinale]|uniref:Uncharacterized protein n=1 Tax=Zingiber officinale TaxID=94328 RepID=A0A8J5KZ37_ZINOF|nr:hypothetical protein ZIOFF_042817 [Zingiber officinale]
MAPCNSTLVSATLYMSNCKTAAACGQKVQCMVVNRGTWTAEEDRKLAEYVQCHGEKNWRTLPAEAGLKRCGKSCRLRWLNYLRPGIKRGNITDEEEDLIIRLHNLLGNRWSLIARRLPGRTDNEIKNHWNTHLSRRSMSIDDLNLKMNNQKDLSPRVDAPPDHLDMQHFELGGEEQLFDVMMMSSNEISGLNYDLNYEFGRWMDEDIDLVGWGTSYAQAAV